MLWESAIGKVPSIVERQENSTFQPFDEKNLYVQNELVDRHLHHSRIGLTCMEKTFSAGSMKGVNDHIVVFGIG